MHIEHIMSVKLVTVNMDDNLATIQELFEKTGFRHLLIVESHRLTGVISDRDLLRTISPFLNTPSERRCDRATLHRRAHQIMARNLITITGEVSVSHALHLFNSHKISCLPVIDVNACPIGIVSWRDIMRYPELRIRGNRGLGTPAR